MAGMGLFFTLEGTLTGASFWMLIGMPIIYSGRWWLGSACFLVGFLFALCNAMESIQKEDKADLRFNILEAHDVVEEMKKENDTVILISALESLARKKSKKRKGMYEVNALELACQEAAYVALKKYSDNDCVVASAISLLALVGKNKAVRQRHVKDESYSLQLPLTSVRSSLERVQEQDDTTEDAEQLAAELQRKSCLWLGALADQQPQLATLIVDEGALETVLLAVDWFRHHAEVNNWGLWAVFMLCFDHKSNQAELVRLGGLTVLCQSVLLNGKESLEVCRHGLAVLFDLLRQPQDDMLSTQKVLEIRQIAIGAGLHDTVKTAMFAFPDSMEIMGMGTEMLVSTGFEGDIPIYEPLE
jgi:hypothetical protein